jgi:hypothetical protein
MSVIPARANVAYYLQTHSRPGQVERLVEVITEGSPGAVVLVGHDAAGQPLNVARLQAMGNVHVLPQKGGYGNFTHVDRYLEAADWLDDNGVDYDWLENLSGQCYPLRPIGQIESTLGSLSSDGYLLYSPVFPERVPAGADQGASAWYRLAEPSDATMRYDYRHWQLGLPTDAKDRLARPLTVLNYVQPWARVSSAYLAVGVRRRRTVFGPDFTCYGGSFFCTLRAACVRYVRDYAKANPDVVGFFRTVLAPEEVFLQSVLVNSGLFSFTVDAKRYIDWAGGRYTHPKTLDTEDAPAVLASAAHWARKLDLEKDARLFDVIDQRVRRGPEGAGGQAREIFSRGGR